MGHHQITVHVADKVYGTRKAPRSHLLSSNRCAGGPDPFIQNGNAAVGETLLMYIQNIGLKIVKTYYLGYALRRLLDRSRAGRRFTETRSSNPTPNLSSVYE